MILKAPSPVKNVLHYCWNIILISWFTLLKPIIRIVYQPGVIMNNFW